MSGRHRFRSAARRAAAMIAFATLLAGCASADKNLTVHRRAHDGGELERLERHGRA